MGAIVSSLVLCIVVVGYLFSAKEGALPSNKGVAAPLLLGKSIAVLPFKNHGGLQKDVFFSDGIHDDLLTQISQIHDIKTISRTSVMGYRDTTLNIRTIG